jgi:hypothetical protein
VIDKLRGYVMPPEEEPQPAAAERAKLIGILSAAMDKIDQKRPPHAGQVPLRRLNRAEYQNTVRDLFGMELVLTDDFPADDTAHGFDNVAEGLSLSPLLMEKYLAAAERALARVVVTDPAAELLDRRFASEALRGGRRRGDQKSAAGGMSLEEEAIAELDMPATGDYLIRVHTWRTCETDDPATLVLNVDGVETKVWSVTAGEDTPTMLKATLPLGAGARRISLRHTWHTANVPKEVKLPEIRLHIAFWKFKARSRG